jgi:hypothetical protein
MKFRTFASLILTGLLLSSLALAQTQLTPDKGDALAFIKAAADIAGNVQQQSLENFFGIYVDDQTWASAAKDSDLGPFFKLQQASPKPGRSAVCFFNEAKDMATCVYFDGKTAFGFISVKAANGGAIRADSVAAAYKPVTNDMLHKSDQKWEFKKLDGVNADDGTALTAYAVTRPNPLQRM